MSPIGWGVSAEEALKSINESEALWSKLHALDCSIEINSPSYAGGSSMPAAENDCLLSKYVAVGSSLTNLVQMASRNYSCL